MIWALSGLLVLAILAVLVLMSELHRAVEQRDKAQDEAETYYAELIAIRAAARHPDKVPE